MSVLGSLVGFVDRDVARWSGTPLATWGIGVAPLLIWALAIGVPADAEPMHLWLMIGFAGFWLALGTWRMALHGWREFWRIRALGAAEALEKKNG
ncbi:hypothetical protein M0208_17075 [Sphingomonas sp. SUN019]|uniref:hypothetical protein n=1 Tax=Sphingomonas sp. SUN019 TaxID=2937788 RepID=UPI00216406B2|nr:hypothetical protein [Sphingomonas sp. SUN019]UVO52140.1 hypothetical protein M0208_17075 [Sphingomonas sp. SUN019]